MFLIYISSLLAVNSGKTKYYVLPFYLVYLLSTTMKSSFGKDCPKDRVVVRVQTREVGLYVSLWFILSYWDMGVHDILLDRQRAGWKNPTTKKDSKIIVRTMFYFFTKLQFLELFILEQLIKTMHFWICREKILLCLFSQKNKQNKLWGEG